jgi:endo-1,3(4)-beta-glucanase
VISRRELPLARAWLLAGLAVSLIGCTGIVSGGGGGDDDPGNDRPGNDDPGNDDPGTDDGDDDPVVPLPPGTDLLAGTLSDDLPPFAGVDHGLAPTTLWGDARAPYATNSWWLNTVLGDGDNTINVMPYLVQVRDELVVCLPALVSSDSFVFSAFVDNLRIGAAEAAGGHELVGNDALSATVEWRAGSGRMTAPLVRGMAYATMKYAGATPRITTTHAIDELTADGGDLSGKRFTLRLNNGQRWILYTSADITLGRQGDAIVASAPFTGTLRAALAANDAAVAALDAHASSVPTGGTVTATADGDRADLTFTWKTEGSGDPLIMALPHHKDLLVDADTAAVSATTIKGPMTGVVGKKWIQRLALPTVTWDAPRAIAPARVEDIRAALRADQNFKPTAPDPYFFGKQVSAMGRLALIADTLDEGAIASGIRGRLATELAAWIGDGAQKLRYDRTWGGIIANGAQNDANASFGQGFYNDHHFHYGYFLYAAAALAKEDPAWAADNKVAMTALVRDIANPYGDDPHFVPFRHKDWYDGHSWAAGLFEFGDSRNQESTSEAVNAWYGLALWGLATGDERLYDLGRVLTATELVSVQKYWQIKSGSDIYPPAFAARKVVGILWGTKVDHATFFGAELEFIHAIQMLPFTPISEDLLPADWIREEYPVLETVLTRPSPVIAESWKNLVFMGHAIIDPAAAWNEVQGLRGFDDGNTKTNTLWWIATRPGAR